LIAQVVVNPITIQTDNDGSSVQEHNNTKKDKQDMISSICFILIGFQIHTLYKYNKFWSR